MGSGSNSVVEENGILGADGGVVCFSFTLEGEGSITRSYAGSMEGFGGWGTLGSLLLWKPNLFSLEAKLIEKGQRKEFAARDVETAPKLQQALNLLIISP